MIGIDHDIFIWINQAWSHPILDSLAPWLREAEHWIPLYVAVAAYAIYRFRKKAWIPILLLIAVFGLTDVTSSKLIKPAIERARPCHEAHAGLLNVELRVHCGSGYSFTSSHATNHFGFAMIVGLLLFPAIWMRLLWFFWATAISLSQVYVGVHFPLDIIAGAVLGVILAKAVYRFYVNFAPPKLQLKAIPRA